MSRDKAALPSGARLPHLVKATAFAPVDVLNQTNICLCSGYRYKKLNVGNDRCGAPPAKNRV